jgi:hypothetical protein
MLMWSSSEVWVVLKIMDLDCNIRLLALLMLYLFYLFLRFGFGSPLYRECKSNVSDRDTHQEGNHVIVNPTMDCLEDDFTLLSRGAGLK